MRLIDATRIEQFILNNCSDNEEINTIYGELINAPSIDLVRCGECKWWDREGDRPFGYCHAEKHCHFSTNWEISIYRTYKSDHFCSDGERRADEHDT